MRVPSLNAFTRKCVTCSWSSLSTSSCSYPRESSNSLISCSANKTSSVSEIPTSGILRWRLASSRTPIKSDVMRVCWSPFRIRLYILSLIRVLSQLCPANQGFRQMRHFPWRRASLKDNGGAALFCICVVYPGWLITPLLTIRGYCSYRPRCVSVVVTDCISDSRHIDPCKSVTNLLHVKASASTLLMGTCYHLLASAAERKLEIL